ncbi:MAG: type I DNA topoisomerase [Candidatus Omnitrophica bacterium]|nr:type I DNA topoisomerase [Candidatus Omnitrophota bacterium]MBU2251230.1 type I DNA topoisomerase [Candidatus Omnitrophota bacterium]
MSKYLVIVESPTKAKTISSILGPDYEVVSSMGHLVDLPANKISVDVENNFEPKYRVISGKEKVVSQLKKKAKNKKIIYLATDPDREGEAISWHIKEQIADKNSKFSRVVFHEITSEALKVAFKHPGSLDLDKVNSQIARRVLDRIVGYNLSPLLWKKIVRGLSAGRVQSIALKFVVEREKEIGLFLPQTTYSVLAQFKAAQESLKAKLTKYKGKKGIFDHRQEAEKCISDIRGQEFTVKALTRRNISRKPPSPYITSLLQQDAFNKLRFSAQKTMMLAQKLYEGIQVNEESTGLITYMRTDSFHVSPKARSEAKEFITENFGKEYLAEKEYHYKKKKGAQLAHEAIRPTSIYRKPQDLAAHLSEDELKLYELIWRRFLATTMKEALLEQQKAVIVSDNSEFSADGRRVVFPGYLKVFDSESDNPLPKLQEGQKLVNEDFQLTEHTTKPPARYNDASLVRLLEEKGIGRPSTYAPIIFTLIKRNYARRERRSFIPTDLGIKVIKLLEEFFPQVMNDGFTALMEEKLDEVERGSIEWHKILTDFYPQFKQRVEDSLSQAQKEIEYSDKHCTKCSGRMIIKWSRKGRFLSCEHFPKCKYAESITTDVVCPQCKEGKLVERRNKRGQVFFGCSSFPKCTYTSRNLPGVENTSEEDQE